MSSGGKEGGGVESCLRLVASSGALGRVLWVFIVLRTTISFAMHPYLKEAKTQNNTRDQSARKAQMSDWGKRRQPAAFWGMNRRDRRGLDRQWTT